MRKENKDEFIFDSFFFHSVLNCDSSSGDNNGGDCSGGDRNGGDRNSSDRNSGDSSGGGGEGVVLITGLVSVRCNCAIHFCLQPDRSFFKPAFLPFYQPPFYQPDTFKHLPVHSTTTLTILSTHCSPPLPPSTMSSREDETENV